MELQVVATSKYMQIVEWVKHELREGTLHTGDRLPSESELCDRFSVSRTAVRQALSALAREGLVESRKGVGSFCTARRGTMSADLAFICYYAGSYIFPPLVTGFERAVQRAGFHMTLSQSENDVDKEHSILLKLREKGVVGIAIIPVNYGNDEGGDGETNRETLARFRDEGLPIVLIDNAFSDPSFPSIGLDDRAVGVAAAAHLADHGHRSVGMVYAGNHRPFRQRRDGFREELARRGIALPAEALLEIARSAGGRQEIAQYLSAAGRPGAVFCANDETAIELYHAASELSLRIPEDLSVVSVDNSEYAVLPGISLDSIDHPSAFIGEKAAEILAESNGERGVRYRNSIVIDPTVVKRGSVRQV